MLVRGTRLCLRCLIGRAALRLLDACWDIELLAVLDAGSEVDGVEIGVRLRPACRFQSVIGPPMLRQVIETRLLRTAPAT